MDLNAALQAAQQYNAGLQKPQNNKPQSDGDNLSGALSDAQKFNELLKQGSPADVGSYTRNAGISALQQSGDVPTVKDASQMYQKGAEAAIDVQKAQAIEEQKRSLTSDQEQEHFGNAIKGWQMLDQLSNSWDSAQKSNPAFGRGSLYGVASNVLHGVGDLTGGAWYGGNPQYDAWQTVTHMARPILNAAILGEGKAQAGEKSNIQGFEANLPEATDTPAIKDQKLNAIRLIQWNSVQSMLNGMDAGGRSAAAATFRQSPTYQTMSDWSQNYTKQLQQQVAPNSFGPVNNGLSPELDSKLSASVGLKPAQQPSPTPAPNGSATPNTNPPGAVKANQGPASVQQQQQQQQPGSDFSSDMDWFNKIFGGR